MANMCIILTELRSAASSKTKQLSSLICEERSGQTVGAAAAAGPGTVHWRGLQGAVVATLTLRQLDVAYFSLIARGANEGSRRFHNHGEGPYQGPRDFSGSG